MRRTWRRPRRDTDATDEPIAVIGLGCRFPGDIDGPESLWKFLSEGRSAIGLVPPDRWEAFDDGSPEVAAALAGTTRWGSFLADLDAFDAEFFDISPGEAAKMDPQQRLLLEVACEALEDAGIPAQAIRGTQTGVFAGACVSEYGYLASRDLRPDRRLDGYGRCAEHHRQSGVVLSRPAWPVGGGRHGMFVVAGRDASGLPKPAHGRLGARHRGRREPAAIPGDYTQFRSSRARCRRQVAVMRSTPAPTGSFAVRAAEWWCSSGWPMRSVMGIGSWRWCEDRPSTRMAGPTV